MIAIPAVFMRGGTSKGLFFRAEDLPAGRAERDAIFLRALGSPDHYGRQLDGMGGGISSLSKVVVIGAPSREDADVDYLFAQVAVNEPLVDYGGTCGNLVSAVAQYAVDEGLVEVGHDTAIVRIHAVNTGKIVRAEVAVIDGSARIDGNLEIPGVSGCGAPIRLEFLDPDGTRTGALLPTGNTIDHLETPSLRSIRVSLVDAANPCVFVAATDVGLVGDESPAALDSDPRGRALLEEIRAAAGVRMGLGESPTDVTEHSKSSPKVAIVAPPREMPILDGKRLAADAMDICARMISMGKAHRAFPITGALCLAVASRLPGTVANEMLSLSSHDAELRIGTPSGAVVVAARVEQEGTKYRTRHAVAYRTARRLMEGKVLVPETIKGD